MSTLLVDIPGWVSLTHNEKAQVMKQYMREASKRDVSLEELTEMIARFIIDAKFNSQINTIINDDL